VKILKNILTGIGAGIVFGYPLLSWVDVLAHQFNGNPHAWNAFVIITRLQDFF
jgi:hypothetical protein